MELFVVCNGTSWMMLDRYVPPPTGAYGRDWIVVSAPDACLASEAGIAYDEERPIPYGTTVYDEAHARAIWTD